MSSEFQELFTLALDHSSSPSLPLLKKRFKGFEHCNDKATAAALGYLAAMRDSEKEEEEDEKEAENGVFDHICDVMDQLIDGNELLAAEEATEITLELVYNWLEEAFVEEGFAGNVLDFLQEQFKSKVKPGVIV